MSTVYFISDLHFGHRNILNFAGTLREGTNSREHDEALIVKWNSLVNKRDKVFVLGDVIFPPADLSLMDEMNGRKVLIRGNHDDRFKTERYLEYFEEVYGILNYKGYWLTHAPIHPFELRGKKNIHGHVHHTHIDVSVIKIMVCISN